MNEEMSYGMPYMAGGNIVPSNIVEMTDPEYELFNLAQFYRGMVRKSDGSFDRLQKPLMNEEGINAVMSIVSSVVNRVTFMSNLEDWQVQAHAMYCAQALIELLMVDYHKFEIDESRRDTVRSTIVRSAINLCHVSLRRPYMEGDKHFFRPGMINASFSNTGQQMNPNVVGGTGGSFINPKSWFK